jgi:hypothetical protein
MTLKTLKQQSGLAITIFTHSLCATGFGDYSTIFVVYGLGLSHYCRMF